MNKLHLLVIALCLVFNIASAKVTKGLYGSGNTSSYAILCLEPTDLTEIPIRYANNNYTAEVITYSDTLEVSIKDKLNCSFCLLSGNTVRKDHYVKLSDKFLCFDCFKKYWKGMLGQ